MIKPNRDAELSVIGAMIMDAEQVMPAIIGKLDESDFGCPELRNIFHVCKELYSIGKPIDAVTVLARLDPAYKPVLVTACAEAPTISNFESYIEIVRNTSKRARAYESAMKLIGDLDGMEDLENCQTEAVKLCENLSRTESGDAMTAKEGFLQFYQTKMEPKTYIKTGISKLDRYAYIDRGDYIVIGARPSAGKTALTLQLMLHMARERKAVYFSLETSAPKVFDRLIANYTATPFSEIKEATISNWVKVAGAADPFGNLKFSVVSAAGWTVAQIRAKAVQLGAEVVFVDYLSLIKSEGKSLYERVTNISMDLHIFAQQSKITVIALSQLNRAGDGEPNMINLRESGQIEQDADVILLLHDLKNCERNSDRKLIIAKNKEGSTGAVTLGFCGEYQRFSEVDTRFGND